MVEPAETAIEPLTSKDLARVQTGGGTGARARLVTVAWVLGFLSVAGTALAGRLAEPGVPPDTAAVVVAPAPRPSEAATPVTTVLLPDESIVVTSPPDGDPTITAVELIVQGFLQVEAASLRVILETGGASVDETTVRPALAFGEPPGSTRHAQFLVRLDFPDPRPTGPMVVRVVAFGRDGERLAVVQRRFRIAPIDRPTLGDDGLLGGLVVSGS